MLARRRPIGVDSSPTMLARAPEPTHEADATQLPFPDAHFASVALLYVLYHLPDPGIALAEAHRVLQPGGIVAVAAPSRHDSPELAELLGPRALTFDAELAPEALAELFTELEVRSWDAPLLRLPTRSAVRDYLIGKGVEPARAAAGASSAEVPLTVTKRGALAFARKRTESAKGGLPFPAHSELVDDRHVEDDDQKGPQGSRREPDDLSDRLEADDEDPDHASGLVAGQQSGPGQRDDRAEDQMDPAPGRDVGDERAVATDHDDVVVENSAEAPEGVERADQEHDHAGKSGPARVARTTGVA
jgi:SAM-dependent methyltransferase